MGGVKVINSQNVWETRKDKIAPIKIGNNVYIGMGAYIMPGVKIGNNCIIGAGAIVAHDIPDESVAVGIPARVVKCVEEYYTSTINKNWLYETAGMDNSQKREYFESIRLRETFFENR